MGDHVPRHGTFLFERSIPRLPFVGAVARLLVNDDKMKRGKDASEWVKG